MCFSGQFSPGYSEGPVWQQVGEELEGDNMSYNKRNLMKWGQEEHLGDKCTISPVLYCNIVHPELKTEYPGKSPLLYNTYFYRHSIFAISL